MKILVSTDLATTVQEANNFAHCLLFIESAMREYSRDRWGEDEKGRLVFVIDSENWDSVL